MLFVIMLAFFSPAARAQGSCRPNFAQRDTSSFTIVTSSFRISDIAYPGFQVHRRQFHLMDADMTTQHLPFFCRQEARFEKLSGLPLRMRLGSMQQTDWLEQKVRTVAPW